MLYLAAVLSLFYFLIIHWAIRHWNASDVRSFVQQERQAPGVSICIVARNEYANLSQLLKSLRDLNYRADSFEVIVVDDHSEDLSHELLEAEEKNNARFKYLKLSSWKAYDANKPKLSGLHMALSHAEHDLILCTDADCLPGKNWISEMVNEFQTHGGRIVCGPVRTESRGNFLGDFQELEMAGTMLLTNAGIRTKSFYSANMANLLFFKEDYQKFLAQHKSHHASGDDIFFINYLASEQKAISFLNKAEACVSTQAISDLSGFIQQRLRWAGKMKSMSFGFLSIIYALVFAFSALAAFLGVMGWMISLKLWCTGIALLFIKWLIENLLFRNTSYLTNSSNEMARSFLLSLCHCLYILWIVPASFYTNKYVWKGRELK